VFERAKAKLKLKVKNFDAKLKVKNLDATLKVKLKFKLEAKLLNLEIISLYFPM
jgi:hypothetical protein